MIRQTMGIGNKNIGNNNGWGDNNSKDNANGEKMHRMEMVAEIIDLIAATFAEIR